MNGPREAVNRNFLAIEIETEQGCYGLDAMLEHKFVPEYCLTFVLTCMVDGMPRVAVYAGLPWSTVRESAKAAIANGHAPLLVLVVAGDIAEVYHQEEWTNLDKDGNDMRYDPNSYGPEYDGDGEDGNNPLH